jgi:hypothetical protein
MSKLRNYFSAHRGLSIAVASTAVLALGAGAAYAAVSGDSSSPPAAVASPTTTLPPSGAATATHAGRHHARAVRGEITAINGNTWTVKSRAGVTLTVDIQTGTRFGTRTTPATQSSFAVGDRVVVAGRRTTTTTVSATRIVMAPAPATAGAAAA